MEKFFEIFKKFIFLYNFLRCNSNCKRLFYILENLIIKFKYKKNIFITEIRLLTIFINANISFNV